MDWDAIAAEVNEGLDDLAAVNAGTTAPLQQTTNAVNEAVNAASNEAVSGYDAMRAIILNY